MSSKTQESSYLIAELRPEKLHIAIEALILPFCTKEILRHKGETEGIFKGFGFLDKTISK